MARSSATDGRSSGKGPRAARGKPKTGSAQAAAGAAVARPESQEPVLPEWDEGPEDLTTIPDLEVMITRPAANTGNDAEARRRIERLREERQLQQALSDVFDL
jgi:hypothetical protein